MHRKQNKLSCQLSADEIDDARYINTEFNLLGEWVACGVNACSTCCQLCTAMFQLALGFVVGGGSYNATSAARAAPTWKT